VSIVDNRQADQIKNIDSQVSSMKSNIQVFTFILLISSVLAYDKKCEDISRWRTRGGKKGCSWVRRKPVKRCKMWGTLTSRLTSRVGGAQRGCKATCGTCSCIDIETWRYQSKKTGKDKPCDWVGKDQKRCGKIGLDGTVASSSCRLSCNTCPVLTEKKLMNLFDSTGGKNWTEKTNWGNLETDYCEWFGITCVENKIRINLIDNNLSGSIPSKIGSFNDQLSGLELSKNKISGTLPSEIGQLGHVLKFNVYQNNLSGSIPTEIGRMEAIKVFQLRENNLTGSIPSEIGMMIEATAINLSSNNLSGNIPSEIGMLSNVNAMILNDNDLAGPIPIEVCRRGFNNLITDDYIEKCT